jgi:hypothetical protein
MRLITSRKIPYLESHSLADGQAREVLFRDEGAFVLYLTDGKPAPAGEERVIVLGLREALIWLNESTQDHGSFWT